MIFIYSNPNESDVFLTLYKYMLIKKGEKERKRKVGRHKRLVKHLQSSENRIVSNS